jgi:hypothetical protein
MTPYLEARAVYTREPCARTFDEDLAAHLLNGFVHSDPYCFLMARKVDSKGDHYDIINPLITFENPDCWHVWLYAGDMTRAFSFADTPLPFVSFERKNKIRFYPWDIISKKVLK